MPDDSLPNECLETKSCPTSGAAGQQDVLRLAEVDSGAVERLLRRYGLTMETGCYPEIPGSYWGDEEAGLIGNRLYARADTPVHSILHEACHYICMPAGRRENLHTDAGGDYDEENAVCYLQIVLADELAFMGRRRMLADMDRWGYSFRLGSAGAWFEQDAEDARNRLIEAGILKPSGGLAAAPVSALKA